MIFTDLPYGTTKNGFDKPLDLPSLWNQYERIINSAIVLLPKLHTIRRLEIATLNCCGMINDIETYPHVSTVSHEFGHYIKNPFV